MLNLVRSFISTDVWRPSRKQPYIDGAYLARMHVGSTVSFGPLPQFLLSEKKLEVAAVKTYRFANYQYVAYELQLDKTPAVSLIVAETEGEQYLAVSRKITPEEQSKLFQGQEIADFMKKPARAELRCKHGVRGFRGWVDYVYHKALEGITGSTHPGNLMGKDLSEVPAAEEFEYFLFTNATEDFAIEIEKYKNGQVDIYTTIYRPMSDIMNITIPRKPRLVVQHKSEEAAFDATLKEAMEAPQKPEIEPLHPPMPTLPVAVAEPLADHIPMLSSPEVLASGAIVGCDINVAGRIIDEAVKNGITLSQLVRKVVGLPMEVKEEVFFSLPLSEADYKALAKRYKLPKDDYQAIHAKVMEEVASFAGVR